MTVKRWTPCTVNGDISALAQAANGQWVEYSDYEKLVDDLRKLLEIARENTEERFVHINSGGVSHLHRHYGKQLNFITGIRTKIQTRRRVMITPKITL